MSEYRVIGLQAEDFMRLKVVEVHPNPTGVTKIVGKNGQGKTSLLNALAAALGGGSHVPADPIRKGQDKAVVIVDLDGIQVKKVWRQGRTTLEVTNKDGERVLSPQTMLDRLVGELTFDPLSFTRLKSKEQVEVLARMAGIDLAGIAAKKKLLFDKRREVGRDRDQQEAAYRAIPPVEAPDAEVDVAALMEELKRIEEVNKEKGKLKREWDNASSAVVSCKRDIESRKKRVEHLENELTLARADLAGANRTLAALTSDHDIAKSDYEAAPLADDGPVRQQIAESQQVNKAVGDKRKREKLKHAAEAFAKEYKKMSDQLEAWDRELAETVATANLPIKGLGLTEDGVTLDGVPFEQASQAEQLKVSVAIGLARNPKLKIALIRDGSLLDADSMALIAKMAADADAQVLIERVAADGEKGILIEDGEVVE